MKTKKPVNPYLRRHRKKVLLTLEALLIATALLATSTYAWLVMSTAPEVVGIETNVGANGSLEVALLNTATHDDMSQITTRVGDSAEVKGSVTSNLSWGNLVNLSDASYGLGEILLMPSQLLIQPAAGGYTVNPNGPLALPSYGTDGRIIELDTNSVSAVYGGGKFGLSTNQTYGVRGIGTTSAASSENKLSLAKTYIATYSANAKTSAINAITANGTDLINIAITHNASETATHSDADINTLKSMLTGLSNSLGYIDTALRYGILANVLQSTTGDATALSREILNASNDISTLFTAYQDVLPSSMGAWVSKLVSAKNTVNTAYNECAQLTGGSYSWEQISPIFSNVLNTDGVYINDNPFSAINAGELLNSTGFTMTLLSGSGLFPVIADFTGDYSTWLTYIGKSIEFKVRTSESPTHLTALRDTISEGEEVSVSLDNLVIDNLGGYAIDLAFRCNAAVSDLQLQISPEQRVYSGSTSGDLQGGGSYMQFSADGNALSMDQMIRLMDAIRVTFVDPLGNVLAMAKLNTSNRSIEANNSIKAFLYLYNYTVIREDGINKVNIGERRTGDVKITELTANTPTAVSAIVWIDGNLVDNTMVSATTAASLKGVLNLQFSSSADLVPANSEILYYSNASRSDLVSLLNDEDELYPVTATYNRGQIGENTQTGAKWNYTDSSWAAFTAAYEYAQVVFADSNSSQLQIKNAYNDLRRTFNELTDPSHEALASLIEEVRALTGTTSETAGYAQLGVFYDNYTEAIRDSGTAISAVDPQSNLRDDGNGIVVPTYSEESWKKLAIALYDAEAANTSVETSDARITAAMTELELAYSMLERAVFFDAYDYNGNIYYRAITDATDTYGKWYDEDFHRVVSDLKILDLDSGAVPATVAKIVAPDYYRIGSGSGVAASIDLTENAYPDFKNDEIIGIRWSISDISYDIDVNGDLNYTLSELIAAANAVKSEPGVGNADTINALITQAQAVLGGDSTLEKAEIVELAQDLAAAIETAKADIAARIAADISEAESSRTAISADEQTVLAAAILEAKTLKAENPELEANDTFNTALTEAETVQGKGAEATRAEYNEAIDALNAQIIANGGVAQTAYNVLVYTIDHSGDYAEAINRVVLSAAVLNPTVDEYGTAFITARILTKNGVVYTASKPVLFYNRAEGIQIEELGGGMFGFKIDNTENQDNLVVCNETPKEYYWSVSGAETITLSNADQAVCKVTGEGVYTLTLTVTMNTGSTYTATYSAS